MQDVLPEQRNIDANLLIIVPVDYQNISEHISNTGCHSSAYNAVLFYPPEGQPHIQQSNAEINYGSKLMLIHSIENFQSVILDEWNSYRDITKSAT